MLYLDTNLKYGNIFKTFHKGAYLNLHHQKSQNHSIEDKLVMKRIDNQHRWNLTRSGFLNNIKSITDKQGKTDYKKIIEQHGAQEQSHIYNNNEYSVYAHMLQMIDQDYAMLTEMQANFENQDFTNDIKQLSIWWEMVSLIARVRLENKILGNNDVQVNLKDIKKDRISPDFVNNKAKLNHEEIKQNEWAIHSTFS